MIEPTLTDIERKGFHACQIGVKAYVVGAYLLNPHTSLSCQRGQIVRDHEFFVVHVLFLMSSSLICSGTLGSGAQATAQSAHVPTMHTPPGFSNNIFTPMGGGSSSGVRQNALPDK
jgi:hypothetical protein